MKIISSHNPRFVQYGQFKVTGYHTPEKCVAFAVKVLTYNDPKIWYKIQTLRSKPKERNKFIGDQLGVSAHAFSKVWQACVWDVFLRPLEEDHPVLFKNLLWGAGGLKPQNITTAWKNIACITQYEQDGLFHLLFIAWEYGVSTQEAKRRLGKGVWKSICKNSFSRNKLLALKTENFDDLRWTQQLSSTFLRTSAQISAHVHAPIMLWANKVAKKERCLGDQNRISQFIHLFRDTARMGEIQGAFFERQQQEGELIQHLSLEQMRAEHDRRMANQQTRASIPHHDSNFTDEDIDERFDREFTHNGVTATLITSYKRLFKEGKEMHHCVGSYGNSIKRGSLIVYSLTDGKYRTTLSIHVNSETHQLWDFPNDSHRSQGRPQPSIRLSVGQHYSHCNATVERDEFHKAVDALLCQLQSNVEQEALRKEKILA